jgi:phage FluMu protein Com
MDVDTAKKRNTTTLSCYRCNELGHLSKDCPRCFDVRFMTNDEHDEWIQQVMVAKDVSEVEHRAMEEQGDAAGDFGANNE